MESSPYVYQHNISLVLAINILNPIVPNMSLVKERAQPRAVAPQPRARQRYKVCMFFLKHTAKGWNQSLMFTNPILVQFWPLYALNSIIVDQNESFY
jgi:hypothetical protein